MGLFKNDYFELYESQEYVYIKVDKPGFDIKAFNEILVKQSYITGIQFFDLKKALDFGTKEPVKIGIFKPQIELSTTSDDLKAYITLNTTQEQLNNDRRDLISKIILELKQNGIIYGIKSDVFNMELEPDKRILIAEADLPQHGRDAEIRYIELPKCRPKINDDGSADHYSMDFIKEVKQGDWLGEKIVSTKGKPGTNVKGVTLGCRNGKDKPLRYDRRSVEEIEEGNKVILCAKKDGVIAVIDGRICVLDHLIIPGNVDNSTGNIEFNGSVTVRGTVQDGFCVVADKDISILGEMGVGAVEKIQSLNGTIYIKGGVSGKGKAIIEAKKGIFVKYANVCTMVCEGDVHIGYYIIDCDIKANNIVVESVRGRILGGSLNAKTRIASQTIGSKMEKKTIVSVEGFDRISIKVKMDHLLSMYKEYLETLDKNLRTMAVFENCLKNKMDLLKTEDYQSYVASNEEILTKIAGLDEQRAELMKILESKGEGEIAIFKEAYPKTFIEIKKIQKVISETTRGTFYSQNNTLHLG